MSDTEKRLNPRELALELIRSKRPYHDAAEQTAFHRAVYALTRERSRMVEMGWNSLATMRLHRQWWISQLEQDDE